MCKYCGTNKYRKIYEHHIGPIPKEENGRSVEVHHIDGNRQNNDPGNLIALTLQDHFDVHRKQGDLAACVLMGIKLNLSPDDLTDMNRQQNLQRVINGTHHLLGGAIQKKGQRCAIKTRNTRVSKR